MNIEEYELENDEFCSLYECSGGEIEIQVYDYFVELTRKDIIAMAQHFNLTADDLKDKAK